MKELEKNELQEIDGGIIWYILGGLLWDFLGDPACVSRGWNAGCAAAASE